MGNIFKSERSRTIVFFLSPLSVRKESARGKTAVRVRGRKDYGKRGATRCLTHEGLKPPCTKTLAAHHRQHYMKVPLNSSHLNGHTRWFYLQSHINGNKN